MNRNVLVRLILIFFFPGLLVSASAEVIQLKDGKTFNGKIIKEDDQSIWIEVRFTNGKLVQKVLKSEVESKEATALNVTKSVNLPSQEREINRANQIGDNSTQKYSLVKRVVEVPREWKRSTATGERLVFAIEPGAHPYGNFKLVVGIEAVVLDNTPFPQHPTDLDSYILADSYSLRKPPFKLVKSASCVVNGEKMYRVEYLYANDPKLDYVAFKDGVIYNFRILSSGTKYFDNKSICEELISRIKF